MSKLSAQSRKQIKKALFGVPSKAPGPGSYPMPDKAHAANAKARAAQFASPEERKRIDARANKILRQKPKQKVKASKKEPSEDSVFFQPAKQGNRRYRHLIPGAHYNLTGIGRNNKVSRGK